MNLCPVIDMTGFFVWKKYSTMVCNGGTICSNLIFVLPVPIVTMVLMINFATPINTFHSTGVQTEPSCFGNHNAFLAASFTGRLPEPWLICRIVKEKIVMSTYLLLLRSPDRPLP